MVGRWFLVLLILSSAAGAQAAPENTLIKCYFAGMSALAAKKSVKPEALPGATKETQISATLVDGKPTDVETEKSSGNRALDAVAVECARAFDFTPHMSEVARKRKHYISFNVIWHAVLLKSGDLKDTRPFAIGVPHMCLQDYPPELIRQGRIGVAALLFNVTVEGKVSGIVIAASSDDDRLDAVAVNCARRWLYQPALRGGAPIEQSNLALVKFALSQLPQPWSPPLADQPLRNCVRDAGVPAEEIKAVKGPMFVSYKMVAGEVTDAMVTRSSGVAALDERGLDCVRSWHFSPVNVDGKPATHPVVAVIDWAEAAAN